MLTETQAAMFRRLSIAEPGALHAYVGAQDGAPGLIEPHCVPLVRLAALVMVDPAEPLYLQEVGRALDAGASVDEIIGVMVAVAPVAGSARVVAAAPKIAMALGYDVWVGLADLDEDRVGGS